MSSTLFRQPLIVFVFLSAFIPGCSSLRVSSGKDVSSPESAETVANSGYSSPESEILFQLMAGELAGHGGDLYQAKEFYTRAAELSNDPEVAARATRIALYAGDKNGGAMKAANRWVELAPEDPEALQTLGLLYVRSGQPRQAITYFERMLDAVDVEDGKGFMVIGASLAKESEGGGTRGHGPACVPARGRSVGTLRLRYPCPESRRLQTRRARKYSRPFPAARVC